MALKVLHAGVLSGVFNLSLEYGQPVADMAAQKGAVNFQGNAKMIISTSGCFVVNFIWFIIAGIRNGSLKEFLPGEDLTRREIFRNKKSTLAQLNCQELLISNYIN
jgi:L-rhamnose-H+ transport protein